MTTQSTFKFACAACGGRIEAGQGYVGRVISCPHCGVSITIESGKSALADATTSHGKSSRTWKVAFIAVVVLLAAGGAFVGWRAYRNTSADAVIPVKTAEVPPSTSPKSASNPPLPVPPKKAIEDLKIGEISFDRQSGTRLVYATGSLTNASDYQRLGVRIELDVFDSTGQKIGEASDYLSVVEPHEEKSFRAMITSSKASEIRLKHVSEDP